MPTTRTTSSSHSAADALKAQLAASSTTTIYVDADSEPTDAELAALLAGGIKAEWDLVRGKLAVRLATEDEMPAPEGTAETTAAT